MQQIQLSIPTPCHESWLQMNPAATGRFCNACNKTVTDFTEMTDAAIYETLIAGNANPCGRFSEAQLSRGVQPRARSRGWKSRMASTVVSLLLFWKMSPAQNMVMGEPMISAVAPSRDTASSPDKHFVFTGTVSDLISKQPITAASIQLKGLTTGTITSEDGHFSLKSRTGTSSVTVIISAIGYEPFETTLVIPLNDFVLNDLNITLVPAVGQLENVILDSYTTKSCYGMVGGLRMTVKVNRVTEFPVRLLTAINDSLRVYPNPVVRGSDFGVQLKLKKLGRQVIQVIDPVGRIVLQQTIVNKQSIHLQQLNSSDSWGRGVYTLRVLTDGKKLTRVARFVVN